MLRMIVLGGAYLILVTTGQLVAQDPTAINSEISSRVMGAVEAIENSLVFALHRSLNKVENGREHDPVEWGLTTEHGRVVEIWSRIPAVNQLEYLSITVERPWIDGYESSGLLFAMVYPFEDIKDLESLKDWQIRNAKRVPIGNSFINRKGVVVSILATNKPLPALQKSPDNIREVCDAILKDNPISFTIKSLKRDDERASTVRLKLVGREFKLLN